MPMAGSHALRSGISRCEIELLMSSLGNPLNGWVGGWRSTLGVGVRGRKLSWGLCPGLCLVEQR